MRFLICTILLLGGVHGSLAALATPVPDHADPASLPPGVKPGMVRYISQPNGWGKTKEDALKDLHTRIFPWYERNFGKKPGFAIDWNWVAYVELSRKRCWQADGRLWWYVDPVGETTDARSRHQMGRFQLNGRR
ncbi:MAG: hypothetical protein SFU85_05895 [Candidatus Methylacidiphilales bacterium]|nr:hypothetical protein [Candidatus Methylacidiphilales bacterium]